MRLAQGSVDAAVPGWAAGSVTHVVCNPPWGLRLQGPGEREVRGPGDDAPTDTLLETWFQLGCFLR